MKGIKILLLFLFMAMCGLAEAQSWSPLGNGLFNLPNYNGDVTSIQVYNNKLYAVGDFDQAGNVYANLTASWDGASWNSLDPGFYAFFGSGPGTDDPFWYLTVYNNKLIVAGNVYTNENLGFMAGIASWDGSLWDTLSGAKGYFPLYDAVSVYNGDLIVGGWNYLSYDYGRLNLYGIAQWNGNTWSGLGSGLDSGSGVDAMVEYNGKLYVGGGFDSAGGKPVNNIASWDGSRWSALGKGIKGGVQAMAVCNGKLYVGGLFDSAGGVPVKNIAVWDDSSASWSAVGQGITIPKSIPFTVSKIIYAMIVYNNKLVVGGYFDSAGGVYANNLAQWDGTLWSAFTSSKMPKNNYIEALTIYNNQLIVAGSFDSIGGIAANSIAAYTYVPPINDVSTYFKIYPNPGNGLFTFQLPVNTNKVTVKVYDVLGQEVSSVNYSQKANSSQLFTLDLSGEAKGIYLYKAISETGKVLGEGKLVKE